MKATSEKDEGKSQNRTKFSSDEAGKFIYVDTN